MKGLGFGVRLGWDYIRLQGKGYTLQVWIGRFRIEFKSKPPEAKRGTMLTLWTPEQRPGATLINSQV